MHRKLLLLFVCLFSLNFAFSQGTIRGVVRSEKDGNAIPFAKVVVVGPNLFAQTDVDGLFS
ncbi:MAG: carboxypeptidase-like regulatory domain-containing protein, partial [Flavobacteriales bacterium]|nr:carboxypeptidase-like regulatory domain-containing protein [Flavobacteriales bacterium]